MNLDHLRAIDGLIRHGEGVHLAELAAEAEGAIVEVGSYTGQSACYLATGSRSGHGAPVHCVDLWDLGGQKYAGKYARRSVVEQFHANLSTAEVADIVTPHRGASADVAATWDGPVDLLYIDGLHTYEGVWSDIRAWTPHLTPTVTVAFHDYCDKFPGVIEAVGEWADGREVNVHDRLAWVQ